MLASSVRRWMVLLAPLVAVALVGACGGSSDDDSDNGTQATSRSTQGGGATSAATSDGSGDGGGGDTDIPVIKDGNFPSGHVHIEISGDKDLTIDADGNGIAVGGFALFTYSSGDAGIQIGLQAGSEDEPGAIAVTTTELATGGAWGTDCEVHVDQSDSEVRGEFSCGEIEAIALGSTDTYTVRMKGTFTAVR